jgi:hypothetical protein
MGYYKLLMSNEAAWEIINQVGGQDCLHFIDMNPQLSGAGIYFTLNINCPARPFQKKVKRCDDLLMKIQSLKSTMEQFNVKVELSSDLEKSLMESYRIKQQMHIQGLSRVFQRTRFWSTLSLKSRSSTRPSNSNSRTTA